MDDKQPQRDLEPVVWLNGRYYPAGQARLSPLDRGFQFGDGLFETLRANPGRIPALDRHIERLLDSSRQLHLNTRFLQHIDWAAVIAKLLVKNRLHACVARVKIIVTRGIHAPLLLGEPELPTVCVLARRYTPPSAQAYRNGWKLHVYRNGHAPSTGRHKSLNYLFFLMAKDAAARAGADEAVVLTADGLVSETASGSLLLFDGDSFCTPKAADQLPGITVRRCRALLEQRGVEVTERPIPAPELPEFRGIWILNSMIGIMAANSVDGSRLPRSGTDQIEALRRDLVE